MPMIFNKVTVKWGDKRTDFSLGLVTKEVKNEIAAKELNAKPFTAYKDVSGRYRWILRSSSAFEDRDKETVSQKALEAAIQKMDATKKYGVLDWWHTPVVLGQCDFSALHSKMLVESGTFKSEELGERIASAIASKEFEPGASLMFAHNEPGPQVVPGRVFNKIEIIRRSLLPAERASNVATTAQIINLAALTGQKGKTETKTKKEVMLKMDAEKEEKLKKLIGPELFEAFLNDTAVAEKSLELAGYSYKAMAPAPAPVVADPPTPDKKLDTKAGGIAALDPAMAADPEDLGEGGEPEGEFEDSPADDEADAIMQGLYDQIGKIFLSNNQALAAKILEALNGANATATKATNDLLVAQTTALKENTTALTKVVGENVALKEKVTALESRLNALDGTLPPAVRARASQQGGVTADKLPPAIRAMVSKEKETEDPYVAMAGNLLKGITG
jgi:hypothetical protein